MIVYLPLLSSDRIFAIAKMQPDFLSWKCSLLSLSTHIRTISPLDTLRKDDAGRNSIYQRLVNRLAHVPSQGCTGVKGREKERGRNGHRGRDVDDRKTKIRNSNLSREQLISRTSPPSLVSAAASPAALGWRTTSPHRLFTPRWRRKPSCRRCRLHRTRMPRVSRSFDPRFLR